METLEGQKKNQQALAIETASIGRGRASQRHPTYSGLVGEPWYWDAFTNGSEALTLSSSSMVSEPAQGFF